MKKVNISSGITEFEDRTFYGCSALENLSIPEGVEYIDWSAFEGCNDLLSIKFPYSLKGIDRHAFWGATEHLNTVYFYGEKAPNLGDSWALIIPRWTKVYVPKGTSDDYCEKLRKWENVVEFDATAIDKVNISADVKEVSRYSVNGQRLSSPTKGLNIVKYSDGSVKKVAVQ